MHEEEIDFGKAKDNFVHLIEDVYENDEKYVITRGGLHMAVIISYDEYMGLTEV